MGLAYPEKDADDISEIMVQDLDIMNVPSRRRNPVIADIFNRLQYMGRRGSGFKKILEDYRIYEGVSSGAKPVFYSELSSFFITHQTCNMQ